MNSLALRFTAILTFLLWVATSLCGQRVVTGVVVDATSSEGVVGAAIVVRADERYYALSDGAGHFSLALPEGMVPEVKIQALGYQEEWCLLLPEEDNRIELKPLTTQLKEVVVEQKRERYRRRGNPAVELMRQVMKHKEANRAEPNDTARQERLTIYWDNIMRGHPFLKLGFDRLPPDTSIFSGQPILPLSLREQDSKQGQRIVGVDQYLNDGSVDIFLEQIMKEVDIYDDHLEILLHQFVSPTSRTLGIAYYKYFIEDTILVEDKPHVLMSFVPVNRESHSFTGQMLISLEERYAIRSVRMAIPKGQNVNFLEQLLIEQSYRPNAEGRWEKTTERTDALFMLTSFNSKVYAKQWRTYATPLPPLTPAETALAPTLQEMRSEPLYSTFESSVGVLATGYIRSQREGSKIDYGSWRKMYGYNPIEGHRFRLGAMTTAFMHPRFFLDGAIAYGTKDKEWKYQATATYSFRPKEEFAKEYPRHDITFTSEYDLFPLGMGALDEEKDHLLVMLGNMEITNRSYQQRQKLTYTFDWAETGLGVVAWWRHLKDRPAGSLKYEAYQADGSIEARAGFKLSTVGLELSYAPGFSGYTTRKGKNSSIRFTNQEFRVALRHELAYQGGWSGGDYTFQHTQLSMQHRLWLSLLGRVDWSASAGKLWGKGIPFPLLAMPEVSPLMIKRKMFHLIQPFEFVMDEYATFHATYHLNGLLLNRLPLINKLQLREVLSFAALYGNTSRYNHPLHSIPGTFRLPADIHPMQKELYMECSVGIENIFQLIRIDYFWRLTHHHPTSKANRGIRFALSFAF